MTDLRKVKIGTIRGPQGYSAYQVAVQNGFVGTEAQWLESLTSTAVAAGVNSVNGLDGDVVLTPASIGAQPAGSYSPSSHLHDDRYYLKTAVDEALALKAATNDPRFTNARTPTAHAASHASGGSDPITPASIGAQPAGSYAPALGADDNYVTDAEKVKLANLSGTNTGDQTLPTWSTISGKPAVVAEGATQAAARTSIGAGTSSFSGAYADLTGKPTLGTAADNAETDFATAAQGAKADTALQPSTAQAINAQTGTTYTLQASDAGKLVTLDNTGAITLNAPGSVFTAGQRVDVLVLNTGMATVVGTSGATANGTPSLVSRARYSAFTVLWLSATSAVVVGDLA